MRFVNRSNEFPENLNVYDTGSKPGDKMPIFGFFNQEQPSVTGIFVCSFDKQWYLFLTKKTGHFGQL